MLILSRKPDESIIVDGKIEIKIVSVEDGRVRVGISAPRDVEIHRKEVYDSIQDENKNAVLKDTSLNKLKDLIK